MKSILLFLALSATLFAQVKFDADFESGNINQVTTTDSVSYNVTTVSDIGGRWFYFRITGVKNRFINVTVTNSDCNRPMYSYDNKTFQRFTAPEAPEINNFRKTFEHDTVYVSYYTPYNYSYLQERLAEWEQSEYVELDTLGFTERNFPMQEMIITNKNVPNELKKRVWIHARVHPGETPCSYHFDGIIDELLSGKAATNTYLDSIIFFTVPFANPEGVYYGRSRTNYDGVDCERQYNKPDNETPREPLIMKRRMKVLCEEKPFDILLNMHSQASSSCTFWIHTAESTSDWFYRREYQLAYLNTSDSPYFDPVDLRESSLRPIFPEGYMWANYGEQVMALTYETPYDRYSSDIWVTNENLHELGETSLYALAEFLELNHEEHFVVDNNQAVVHGTYEEDDFGKEFFGDNYYILDEGTDASYAVFETGILKPGKYSIYGWWQANGQNSFNTQFEVNYDGNSVTAIRSQQIDGNQWNGLREVELENESKITIKVKQSITGKAIVDAFRIICDEPTTGVRDQFIAPTDFVLSQNYPNPFNPSTTINVQLNKANDVRLEVYNTLGELVEVVHNGYLQQGNYNFVFNAYKSGSISSGVYYYRLTTPEQTQTKGMVLVK